MIVTEEGKNIYPEDIETVFESLPGKEFCVFAANYIWPKRSMVGEKLVLALHLEPGQPYDEELRQDINTRNNRLLNYKRIHGWSCWRRTFPGRLLSDQAQRVGRTPREAGLRVCDSAVVK